MTAIFWKLHLGSSSSSSLLRAILLCKQQHLPWLVVRQKTVSLSFHVAAMSNSLELSNSDHSSAGDLLLPSLPLPFHEWPGCNLRQIVSLCLLAAWDEVSWGMVAARFQIDGVLKPQSKIRWQQNDPPWGISHNMLSRFLGQLPTSHSYVSNNYPSRGRRRALALAADDCPNKCV